MQYTDYKSFIEKMEDILSELLEETEPAQVKRIHYLKNNSVVKEELQILTPGARFGKVFDPEPLFQRHLTGAYIEQLADEVMDVYMKEEPEEITDIWEKIRTYDMVRDRIFVRVINGADNQMLLALCPHVEKMDLALTFRIELRDTAEGLLSMTVDNTMFNQWQISLEMLYETAIANTERKFPAELIPVNFGESETVENHMYAVTNTKKINGATAVFYSGTMKKLSEILGPKIYLMPSSIHEMMAVAADDRVSAKQLKAIISDANQTVVTPEERLGSHVYKYHAADDLLYIEL